MLTQNRQYLILNSAPIRCNSIFLPCCPLSMLPRRGQEVISDNVQCFPPSVANVTLVRGSTKALNEMTDSKQCSSLKFEWMSSCFFGWGGIIPSPLDISYISVHAPTHPAYTLISHAFFTSMTLARTPKTQKYLKAGRLI